MSDQENEKQTPASSAPAQAATSSLKPAATDFSAKANVASVTGSEPVRQEMGASAIARLMGVATSVELKLLEGKLDLVSTRLTTFTTKLDKIITQFSKMPTGSDLERIDVQIGGVKTLLRDLTVILNAGHIDKPDILKANTETNIITEDAEAAE